MAAFGAKQGGKPAKPMAPKVRQGENHASKSEAPKGQIKFGQPGKPSGNTRKGFGA